ncbi:MAG: 1-acyl-sn-glycerol-3-phosphate acyltransferase, partial [Sphingobacteriales bacterium]
MLYFFAKIIMTPALGWYFRRKFFLGKDRIPVSGPMVIIASHSASFLDAILMGVMMARPIHFYVRGDIFRRRIVRWIFSQLHMIPVFSADLAKQDLLRNTESFDQGSDILCKGGVLLIFPEGISRLERNLMPFR